MGYWDFVDDWGCNGGNKQGLILWALSKRKMTRLRGGEH
jgi:hypothetical protein